MPDEPDEPEFLTDDPTVEPDAEEAEEADERAVL